MFLEINNIKKHFGEDESRVEVLKGIFGLVTVFCSSHITDKNGSGRNYGICNICKIIFI